MDLDVGTILTVMGVPSAVTGFCFWILQRNISKTDAKREEKIAEREAERREQEKARERKDLLLLDSIGAAITLGEATALAIRNGKCNGEIDAALKGARDIKKAQSDFFTEQGVKHLSGGQSNA